MLSQKKDQNNPTITVVIPAYNEEKLIKKTLRALKQQTYKNFEIIIVDNNSTDNTAVVAKSYNAQVVLEKEQGYVYSLNRGLKEAKGEIIAITDADSLPDQQWLYNIAQAMQNDDVVAAAGLAAFDIRSQPLRFLINNAYMMFTMLHFGINKPHINGFNAAVKKKYVQKMGYLNLDYKIGADVYLGLCLKRYGKVVFLRDAVVVTSTRRWKKEATKAFLKYTMAYFYVVWLHKPFSLKLDAIR